MFKLALPLATLTLPLLVFAGPIQSAAAAEPISTPADPLPAQNDEPAPSVQRLVQMFSSDIQTTLQACWEEGRADLAAGAGPDGSLQCGNGEASSTIQYTDYIDTVSDIFVASSLVGFRTAIAADAQLNPQLLAQFLQAPEGSALLQQAVQMAIQQSQLVSLNSAPSADLLTGEVMTRMVPVLTDPTQMETLLGTPEQYAQVVTSFCTAPGMSVSEAQSLVPDLTSIQLYAICVQESGIADDVLRLVNP